MTMAQFRDMLATLPGDITIVHFRGMNGVFPRLVWQEGHISQSYASDSACTEKTVAVAEYLTKNEDDPNFQIVKDLFRENKMPFECEGTYDEQNDVISYLFNLWLEEDVSDDG